MNCIIICYTGMIYQNNYNSIHIIYADSMCIINIGLKKSFKKLFIFIKISEHILGKQMA